MLIYMQNRFGGPLDKIPRFEERWLLMRKRVLSPARLTGKIMKYRMIAIYILVGLLADVTNAADYYVSTSGKDSNPGTASSPWKYCPGMRAWSGNVSLNPGDTVYFDNSDTWEHNEGYLLYVEGGVTYDGETWGGGNNAILKSTGNMAVLVRMYEDDAIEPTVLKGFEIDGGNYGGVTHTGAGVGINWPNSYNNLTGAVKRIENCHVHHTGYDREQGDGGYSYGILVGAIGKKTKNVEVLNCLVHDTARTGITIYPETTPAGAIESVVVRNCEVYNTGVNSESVGRSISVISDCKDILVEYNYIHTGAGELGVHAVQSHNRGPTNVTFRYNVVIGGDRKGFADESARTQQRQYNVYGNLFIQCADYGVHIFNPSPNCIAKFYNNTFFDNCQDSNAREVYFASASSTPDIEFINNIVWARSGSYAMYDSSGDTIMHSNNLYYRNGGGNVVYNGGSTYTAATASNYEDTAQSADPLFIDTNSLPTSVNSTSGVNNDGLQPQSGSVAIDNGTSGFGSIDIDGTSIPVGDRDIGAYESSPDGGEIQIPEPPSRPRVVPDI